MQNWKSSRFMGQFTGLVALTFLLVSYQNCARLPQFSSSDTLTSLASELTVQDKAALALLEVRCAACHSPSLASGGFGNVSNLAYMTSRGYIIPGSPIGSPVYDEMASNSMPPGSALQADEKQQIFDWIAGMSVPVVVTPGGPTTTTIPTVTTMPPAPLTASFASLNSGVFKPYCLVCHSGAGAAAGYRMDTYADVIARVSAGNANNSILHQRMTNAGAPMPTAGILPANMTNLVRDWINAGAQNN
jgi:mono/diheme cytochrome c family protein